MISYLFNEIFYRPLLNGLIFLYNVIPGHDIGLSIIVLTVAIRLALWPFTAKTIKSQKIMEGLKPKIEEINRRFKNDKESRAKGLMGLYKENKINPLGGFLSLIIQIPIIIALWRVFLNIIKTVDKSSFYWFVMAPDQIQFMFLGLFDLSRRNVLLAIVAAALQYFQTKMIMPSSAKATEGGPSTDFSRIMSRQMLYMGPVLSIIIFFNLPAAIPLYWTVVTLLTILQQYLIQKHDYGREIGKS
ncbi:MAG: 60 kDa inner membrane insertion protein [Candidatus Azambacteria bacterium GW2011_GWA2_42_9]|nr:MAG: 60 kDa inner membrane insertion protein [Candidatus Azambacteria bacterium GW2011_GWB1_42_17]KKS46297.1 MAG: 60 kDa inner membrane insertion protein [Candidatus Azambacteria bacterium GW2011_GWA1_42_19]KKS75676.1 MAG: 60 kDa inner membrane insertion protein [Candidatus Azambacteria bacterium GW2011_GWA2_42_9]KKS88561.1 MAG: Membrane protein insertase, YidC/Oxa1 family [Parcubacteria group bacterium GW2011_GWC1_43_11]